MKIDEFANENSIGDPEQAEELWHLIFDDPCIQSRHEQGTEHELTEELKEICGDESCGVIRVKQN